MTQTIRRPSGGGTPNNFRVEDSSSVTEYPDWISTLSSIRQLTGAITMARRRVSTAFSDLSVTIGQELGELMSQRPEVRDSVVQSISTIRDEFPEASISAYLDTDNASFDDEWIMLEVVEVVESSEEWTEKEEHLMSIVRGSEVGDTTIFVYLNPER